ncbi:uncharacterized protein LOC5575208 isoform X2 [Aedes aegypti]|uniref:Uncharacterized protein n=1 Tax=Aedes aegypti TaxID=7159 RepID=A0A6I8TVI2_AEDAE|nr:uncharacterized protein LOC5575208 isoform X2 [Aedes aegypti]
MSKDPTQSRIPRIGSTTSSSRIPIPGSIRLPQARFQSKIAKPSTSAIPAPSTPFATPAPPPAGRHLRPPKSTAISIARSYSGDALCGESTPLLPALAASTPAPTVKPTSGLEFYQKLELASTENLHDTFALPSSTTTTQPRPASQNVDYNDDGRMLVDESLELVGADSTDNIVLAQQNQNGMNMLKPASSNETVTLNCDGNVTYEVKRSETFVKSSQESLKLGGSRESLNRTRGASLFQSNSSGESPVLDKTHTILIDVGDCKGPFSSTMVSDRPMNVTQSIPNVTAEIEGMPHINRRSLMYQTHEVLSPDRLLPTEPMVPQRPTRLTFNMNETMNILNASDPTAALNKTQVFSSTMHSPLAVGTIEDVLNVTRDIHGSSLVDAMQLDVSGGDRTLVAEDLDGAKFGETMDVDDGGVGKEMFDLSLDEPPSIGKDEVLIRPIEGRTSIPARQRYSFGLDLTETLLHDCSIELCDSSISSAKPHLKSPVSSCMTKQGSFEMDESLGILTPDQMKEFLDSTTTNTNNTNNLELQLNTGSHKHGLHHCRIDQTPSPEELPLDPIGVKTDMSDIILPSEILSNAGPIMYQEISQTDSDSKTDQMTKSATSKVSNSFITSITSITSLDTGYQGDGEMSRPASRGADHSPSNGPRLKNQAAAAIWNGPVAQPAPVPRRPDPMTDSDFFTESDADDVLNRGDRRAQIIDGQLYGPMMQGANVFINQQPQNDDSCMESSGIFTDVENRGEDDLVHRRSENEDRLEREEDDEHSINGVGQQVADSDMSPDVSTDTISSSNTACSQKKVVPLNARNAEHGASCLQTTSMVPPINANDSKTPAQLDGSKPESLYRESDVTKHVVTPSLSGGAAAIDATASHQIQSSPSATSLVSDAGSRIDCGENGVGVTCVGEAASSKAESATNIITIVRAGPIASSTDSLSGALVGSGGIGSSNVGSVGKKPGSSRKQQKNESNLVLKKHEMSSRAVRTRLFKESAVSKASRSVGGSAMNLDVENECENQENKRPTSANRGGCGPRASASVGNLSFTKKSATPNKWDAVMSKIAENKAVVKKNFSDVKSKISCGKTVVSTSSSSVASGRRLDSPASLKSPPSECSSVGNRSIGAIPMTGGKRTISGSVKRRTHSKDSQQSSQSDLSLTGGSPKLQTKASSTRPAKKRDVRTINSSSSDLGPPSKTVGSSGNNGPNAITNPMQTQHQRASLRAAATLQKRISTPGNVANATIPSIVPEQLKGSPPPPKRNFIAKRTLSTPVSGNTVVKTPLKDHNRLVGPTPNVRQQPGANSPKTQTKTLIRSHPSPVTPPTNTTTTTTTPSCPKSNNNNNNTITSNGTALKNAANIQRNGTIILEKTSSPLILGGRDGGGDVPPVVVGQKILGSKETTTLLNGGTTGDGTGGRNNVDSYRNNNLVDISLLNHANRGVEALGVLVQYLVFNLDAFSCPTVKKSHQKTTHDLLETKSMLDEERSTCQSLKQQLLENTEREAELQELHRCEINKVEACLEEHQRSAADRITALEAEALRKELEANDKLLSTTELYESRLAEREAELKLSQAREQDLLQRINALTCTENELREKVHSSELEFSERLQAAAMRERDLSEQLKQLNRQMEEMRRAAEARELELEEKISLTQDECTVLRHSRSSLEPSPPNEDHEPPQRTSLGGSFTSDHSFTGAPLQTNRSSGNLSQAQVLQDEVNSLRCVLDLKQREISDLRKLTQEYERDAKELPGALVKISALESRIEDLQVQLRTKTEEEKDLQQKLKLLQDNLKQETKTKTRLSQHNEELQWKLKQNSEKFSHVYAELSKSYHDTSSFMNATRVSLDPPTTSQVNHSRSSAGSERVFEMDDLSPPTSPVIKGVVEKSDSVSWVLEMDDEPPEISASRMVRRAGSFRSSYANAAGGANQDVKRQRCFNTSLNGIQQSSSVGSILKQQEASPSKMGTPTTPRLRSKSVSIKAATEPPKKIVRSNSGASSSAVSKPIRMAEMPLSWKEPPLYSSSPYAHKRFLNERMENGVSKSFRDGKDLFLEETEFLGEMGGESPYSRSRAGSFGEGPAEGTSEQPVEFFHRDKTPNFKKSKENRGLITCDTTALTEYGSDTPAHKKRREFARKSLTGKSNSLPKEAAGEALVSGSNSDDEASSSSCLSDDLSSGASCTSSGSSSSSSSSTGGPSCSSRSSSGEAREALVQLEEHGQIRGAMSSEDPLLRKIVASLNGTISNEGNDTPMEVSWSEDGDPSESIV